MIVYLSLHVIDNDTIEHYRMSCSLLVSTMDMIQQFLLEVLLQGLCGVLVTSQK